MNLLVETGRIPITTNNMEVIVRDESLTIKEIINKQSLDAGLTMIGFNENAFKKDGDISLFEGYGDIGNVLFVHSHGVKEIE